MKNSSKQTGKRKRKDEKLAKQWQTQAGWLIKTITNLHESPTGHGLGWTKGMIKHYAKDYYALRKQTPRGCFKVAGQHDDVLSTIIEHYESIG